MNNRRDFLVKSSLATAAMLVLKPMQHMAANVYGFDVTGSRHQLVLLHTSYLSPNHDHRLIQQVAKCKNAHSQALLLSASGNTGSEKSPLRYDADMEDADTMENGDYTIVEKAGIKTGIIRVKRNESNVVAKVNELATYLKKEKRCTVVLCLSQLGYKSSQAPDDLTLAAHSTDIDVIIGGHPQNFHALPVIALNSHQSEVIIHAAGDNSFGYGKIAIDFDGRGKKRHINFAV